MLENLILTLKIKNKTRKEKYMCYLDEIKKTFLSWNIPNNRIDQIILFAEQQGILREEAITDYRNLSESAKFLMTVFCEYHMTETDYCDVRETEIEDDCGILHSATAVTECVFGEYLGQKLWFPKTMYLIQREDDKLFFYEDAELQNKNERCLIDVYRAVNGLLTSSEIRAFCDSIGISEQTLSLLLDFEIDAIDWYCTNTVQPADRNQTLISLIENRDILLKYIENYDDGMNDLDEVELINVVSSIYDLDYAC